MKLLLYSGGGTRENKPLDGTLKKWLGRKKAPRVVFVPSWYGEESHEDFRAFSRRIRKTLPNARVEFFALDRVLTKETIESLFASEMIYIEGGNTFFLLSELKRLRLLSRLRRYVREGGILGGLSAGAIVMTGHIGTAVVPTMEADDNDVGLKDWRALSLVDFEFSPHYEDRPRINRELAAYSKRSRRPVLACADGAGVIVQGGRRRVHGRAVMFYRGERIAL